MIPNLPKVMSAVQTLGKRKDNCRTPSFSSLTATEKIKTGKYRFEFLVDVKDSLGNSCLCGIPDDFTALTLVKSTHCRTPSFSSLTATEKIKTGKCRFEFLVDVKDSLGNSCLCGIPDDFTALTLVKSTHCRTPSFSSLTATEKIKTGKYRFEFLVDVKRLELLTLSV